MRITLCGSARFENEFKKVNRVLTLAGHVVYSLAVYPSDMNGNKDWYSPHQKLILDEVHFEKIRNSEGIYIIAPGGYIGESTKREIELAYSLKLMIMCSYPLTYLDIPIIRTCPFAGCTDPTRKPPCSLCYE